MTTSYFYPNLKRDKFLNDYKNKNELKFKRCNFEIQRWISREHKIQEDNKKGRDGWENVPQRQALENKVDIDIKR